MLLEMTIIRVLMTIMERHMVTTATSTRATEDTSRALTPTDTNTANIIERIQSIKPQKKHTHFIAVFYMHMLL